MDRFFLTRTIALGVSGRIIRPVVDPRRQPQRALARKPMSELQAALSTHGISELALDKTELSVTMTPVSSTSAPFTQAPYADQILSEATRVCRPNPRPPAPQRSIQRSPQLHFVLRAAATRRSPASPDHCPQLLAKPTACKTCPLQHGLIGLRDGKLAAFQNPSGRAFAQTDWQARSSQRQFAAPSSAKQCAFQPIAAALSLSKRSGL